jgi:hypothetical protein
MSFQVPTSPAACVVCGTSDARALCTTRLEGGELVVVCGTHELMHRRGPRVARSVDELKGLVRERRRRAERRLQGTGDELGLQLTEAFAGARRKAASDRRRTPA